MKTSSAGGTIEGIQWLRAIAALMVVMHHARHSVSGSDGWPEFGATGVDIFFIISGFVMAHTTRRLAPDLTRQERLGVAGDFLRKRIARVVPLYWVALLWTARRELLQGTVGIGFIKDLVFFPRPNPRFPDALWPVIIQGWTLNYEMFFYALFTLALFFGRPRIIVLISTLVVLVALPPWANGVVMAINADDWASAARRFYTDNILLEFGFGVLLQRFVSAEPSLFSWPRWVYSLLVLTGFVLIALGNEHWPRSVTQGLPALLIVWASLPACRGLRSRVLERLADASYAIYLFHWASFGAVKPVAVWLEHLGVFSLVPSSVQVAILMLLHISTAIVAGLLVHLWIERPLVRLVQQALHVHAEGRPQTAPA